VLSREAIRFLETEKKTRGKDSTSSVVEEIIEECRRRQRPQDSEAAISAYYDSLSDAEREENQLWGQFSETQFPAE
jgi:hypothetical protein